MALARAAAKAKPSVPAAPLVAEPAPAQPTATAPRSGEAGATPAARAVRRATAAAAAARQAARQMAQKARRLEAERHLFSRSVGPVTSLRNPNLARLRHRLPPPLPVQHWLDEERVLLESISDDFDVSTLLDTDDQLSFRRPGIGVEVTRRLRSGHWSIQRQLDLHGLRVDEAREALGQFIRHAHKTGLRCVRVVHGKGLGSPGKSPVLKSRVQRWLVQKNEVLAFVQARPMDGGAGALVVLLKPVNQRNT
ncbi:MAG: DNA mismatch repair protein MutS [Acidovorax sp. 17-64-282]|nr:MAG: DNA mismatch repair protein MutS [Acidovorax sp. 17-64-282]